MISPNATWPTAPGVRRSQAQDIHTSQVLEALLHTGHRGFLSGTNACARVVVLLVGLVLAIRVADLGPEKRGKANKADPSIAPNHGLVFNF